MVDFQETQSIHPDQIWKEHADKIREYAFFLKNVKTIAAENFINRDLYQSLQRERLHELPRLREFFRSILVIYEIQAAFQNQTDNPLKDQTTQAIILRAIGLKLDDVIKTKFIPEEQKQYKDYQVFYEQMLRSLQGLKNQVNDKPLPKLTSSLKHLYIAAINQAYDRNLHLDTDPLQSAIDRNFDTHPNLKQTFIDIVQKK